jgi:hypothetical protein
MITTMTPFTTSKTVSFLLHVLAFPADENEVSDESPFLPLVITAAATFSDVRNGA